MREGKITKHDLERIIDAVEHEMEVEPLDKPRVAVSDLESESDDSHVVDIQTLTCTCPDFEYNCRSGQYCKHIYSVVFRRHRML
jgi:methyl coenzyme M reductase subunit D